MCIRDRQKLKAAVEAHTDETVAAVLQDTRKPEGEIRVTEVLNVLGNIQLNIDSVEDWMKPTEVTPTRVQTDKAMIIPEARGVCLILGPWNFPLGLVLGPLAAARLGHRSVSYTHLTLPTSDLV